MSETAWPPRAQVPPLLRPEVMIGAASPLWGYISGTVAAGVGFWWMTRWMHLGQTPFAVAAAPAVALADSLAAAAVTPPAVDAATAAAELPAMPIGGEAAPISPVLESLAAEAALGLEVTPSVTEALTPEPEAEPEPEPAPVAEAAPPVEPEPSVAAAPPVEAVPPAEAAQPAEAAEKPPRTPPSRARKARDAEPPKPH